MKTKIHASTDFLFCFCFLLYKAGQITTHMAGPNKAGRIRTHMAGPHKVDAEQPQPYRGIEQYGSWEAGIAHWQRAG